MHEGFVYLGIALLAGGVGFMACALLGSRRERLDAQQLAERADANGRRLLTIAGVMRDRASGQHFGVDVRFTGPELRDWADTLEDVAVAHLECVNAISLDSLQRVSGDPVYLGEFQVRHTDAPGDTSGARMRRDARRAGS